MQDGAQQHRFAGPYLRLLAACGAGAVLLSLYRLPLARVDLKFLLLAAVTLAIGSRVTVKIPRLGSHISVSDTFVFLTLLVCGGEAAVLLAALESFCSSLRFATKRSTLLLNAAVMGLSTFVTVWALRLSFGDIDALLAGGYSPALISFLCVMALVQYVFNSGSVAVGIALKTGQPLWATWRRHYLWTSVTYFAGASAAAIITRLIDVIGFTAFIATTPIIAIVYLTYQTYLKNIEAAERHVAEIQESEERFRSAFDYASIGMALVSPEGRWLQVNPSLCAIVGYTEGEMLDTDFQALMHPEDVGAVLAHVGQLLDGRVAAYQAEKRYVHKGGHEVWVLLSVSRVRQAGPGGSRLIFQIQDITDRRRAEERLLHDAFHDTLTGLPNRALFVDRLKQALARTKRLGHHRFAVLFLDLDRFKVVNDSLGHMVGDQLLVGIARRLETCLRPGDTVARLGGDEFTILLEEINDTGEAIGVAKRVEHELSVPFNLGGHEVFTTVSVGIAPSEVGYDRPEDILRDADTAMYRAKEHGKARHEVFDRAMHAHAVNLLQMETDLRRAVERGEFVLHYQPIVSLETGRVSSLEALIRWRHPKRGFISPAEFIPMAEETGLIFPVSRWVLREACAQMRGWREEFGAGAPKSVSVNLSGRQFAQADLTEQIAAVVREAGIDPGSLTLEITESVVMENIETAGGMLRELRGMGIESSIDDFGTGYSSLSYLHRFPSSTLKIDRSFVGRMTDHSENIEIVRTIIMLARSLGMSVVAEGVETQEQLAQLRALGCGYAQGFYFSKPVCAEAVTEMIAAAHRYALPEPSGQAADGQGAAAAA